MEPVALRSLAGDCLSSLIFPSPPSAPPAAAGGERAMHRDALPAAAWPAPAAGERGVQGDWEPPPPQLPCDVELLVLAINLLGARGLMTLLGE